MLTIRAMKKRSRYAEIRRKRLIHFVDTFDGSDKDAAAKLGIDPGYLSQLKMGKSRDKPTGRDIGEDVARGMEEAAGLHIYWFDYASDDDALRAKAIASLYHLSDEKLKMIADLADNVLSLPDQ